MRLAKSIRLAVPIFLSFSLIACGGGSGFSAPETTTTSTDTTTTTSQNPDTGTSTETDTDTLAATSVKSLVLSASSTQLSSDGVTPVTISISAKDADNVLVDVPDVAITVDNGANITAFEGTGTTKTATLTTAGSYENRLLTVTATLGDIVETIQVEVVGTQLSITGTDRIHLDTATEYVLFARDSSGNPIGNQVIAPPTVTGDGCFIIEAENGNLNSTGEYRFQLSGSKQTQCTITANDFGATATQVVEVSDFELTITSTTESDNDITNGDDALLELPINTNETINLRLTQRGQPAAQAEITLNTTRGMVADSITTDVNGDAQFSVQSDNVGETVITATFNGITATLDNVVFVTPEQSNIRSLRLIANAFQLESDGSNPITVSALAKDANNVLIDDPVISLSVDNEADITAFSGTAIKTASLTPGIPRNRALAVTASAGTITETLNIDVVGTQLSLVGPERIALNEFTEYRLLARDSGGNPIANQMIAVPTVSEPCSIIQSVDGNVLNTAGEYVFQITATQGGNCTLSISDFGTDNTLNIAVSGDEFELNARTDQANDVPNGNDEILEIRVNTSETIDVRLRRDNNPVANETIQLSTTRGTITDSVVTNGDGNATFTINSANAGNAVITASTANGLTDTLTLEFVATVPTYINTQASSSIVRPLGTSTITTRLRDIDDNPVANADVEFNLEDTVGGRLNNSEARTDLLGVASVEYTAGSTTSGLDGVVITSIVQGDPSITDRVNLTVGGDALRVVLGTNNELSESGVIYQQSFVVLITDSAGNPVQDQEVNVSIVPTIYYKGTMVVDVGADQWVKNQTAFCPSEDINRNGQLDLGEDKGNGQLDPSEDVNGNGQLDAGEDINGNGQLDLAEDVNGNGQLDPGEDRGNGQLDAGEDINDDEQLEPSEDNNRNGRLEPTNDASVAPVNAASTTGDDGTLLVTVSYPQSRALWSRQELVVRISSNGTDFEERTSFDLGILASDVSNTSIEPPNRRSPYGVLPQCDSPD